MVFLLFRRSSPPSSPPTLIVHTIHASSSQSTCDLIVACNSTGFDLPKRLLGYKLHDGIIGVAGLVSAISAVYKAYPYLPPSHTPTRLSLLAAQAKKTA